jgi:hypothetical protein
MALLTIEVLSPVADPTPTLKVKKCVFPKD